MSSTASLHYIDVTVQQFAGTQAILKTADGQTIKWSIKNLPDDISEGDALRLQIRSDMLEQQSQEELARTMLNTLLKS